MEKRRPCSPCGPGCRELDPREPRDTLFSEGMTERQNSSVSLNGTATNCSCACSSGSAIPTAPGGPPSPNPPTSNGSAGNSCSTANPTTGQGLSTGGQPAASTSCSMSGDPSGATSSCMNAPTVSQGPLTTLGGGQPSTGSINGGGTSRIRRLLRGRAHSSHGATSSGSSSNNASCSGHGEERFSGNQLTGSCRGRNAIGNIRNGRPSASKSTSSLLDASSSSCCGAITSNSAIWSTSNSLYNEVVSPAIAMPSANHRQHQQQLPATTLSGSSANANVLCTTSSAMTPHKTKNKVGSWALKLCKRSSPGSNTGSSNNSNSQATSQGTSIDTLATHCTNGPVASKSTNSSPSKGPAPLGYSVCHQGGLSASLPLSAPQENIHRRYHYHHNHHSQNQQQQIESGSSAQLKSDVLCACCTAGTSRDVTGGGVPGSSSGVSATQSSGTPNATRRRMATAIINQLSSSSSLEANDGSNQGPSPLGAFATLGGSDDLDERARIERAREIAEGVDPPPGFIRAHEVIPDEIAAALRSLNLDALPWDVLGKIWDLNPSPQQIPLSLASAATGHSHGLAGSSNSSNSAGANGSTTVHTTVDYMHCLVPDLAQISRCGFYWGKMDRYEAERLLQKKPEGSFLLRDSAQEEYLFSVSFRRYGRSLHARIEQWNHNFSFDSHDPGVFSSPTVCGLIEHYKDPACCMYFEPMLTIPINRNFPFSLQHLSRCAITERVKYDDVSRLHLPKPIKTYLREYHYKQRLRVRNVERE